jgi:hypothetical protein
MALKKGLGLRVHSRILCRHRPRLSYRGNTRLSFAGLNRR